MDYLSLGGRQRDFTLRDSVSFSITHRVLSLCLHLSSLYLCLLFSTVDVILIGVEGHLWKAQWKEKPNDEGRKKLTM